MQKTLLATLLALISFIISTQRSNAQGLNLKFNVGKTNFNYNSNRANTNTNTPNNSNNTGPNVNRNNGLLGNSNKNADAVKVRKKKYPDDNYFFQTYSAVNNNQYIGGGSILEGQEFYSDAYAESAMKNVLTKDKNETEFLRRFLIYCANNKRSNTTQLYVCDANSVNVSVLSRDNNGMPIQVYAKYNFIEEPSKQYEISVLFEDGLPYHIWYPNEDLSSRLPTDEGAVGKLKYAPKQIGKMVSLCDRDDERKKQDRIKTYNPRINDSLTKVILKQYPGQDLSKYLTRTVKSENRRDDYQKVNGYGDVVGTDHDYYIVNHIKIENKCSKSLKVVGISQVGYGTNKKYGIVWRTFKPKEVIEWDRSSNNLAGGMIASILLGGGEMQDIDLSRINKKYDTEDGGEIQYIRVVENK